MDIITQDSIPNNVFPHLGIYGKLLTPLPRQPYSPNGFQLQKKSLPIKQGLKQPDKYQARKLTQATLNQLTPKSDFRSCKCCGTPIGGKVIIRKSNEHAKNFYTNMETCKSVWLCPVCSNKIMVRRGFEISKAISWAYSNGHKVIMVTLTHPHFRGMSLAHAVSRHKDAHLDLKKGRQWSKLVKAMGYVGDIVGCEVTWTSTNGWHFHQHSLWIVGKWVDTEKLSDTLKERWLKCCRKAGIKILKSKEPAFMKVGVHVMDNCQSSQYLEKFGQTWGAEKEIVHGANKRGAGKTPFEIGTSRNPYMKTLFKEYAYAIKGIHQLRWGRGLKAKVGIQDKTDEQIEREEIDSSTLTAVIPSHAYKLVRMNDDESRLLEIANDSGYNGVRAYFLDYGIDIDNMNGHYL